MKNKTTASLFAFFLGGIGLHRFYLGQPILGILYLFFCWTFIPFLIGVIDFISFITYSDEKFNLKYNTKKKRTNKKRTIEIQDVVSISSESSGKNKTVMTLDLDQKGLVKLYKQKQKEKAQAIRNFNYQPIQIQRQGVQLLESINVLYTTKNVDTIKNRYNYILKMYDSFIKASYNKRYISDIQISVDQYKTMYYDRIINDFELKLLTKPDRGDLIDYYSECLFNCFNKFMKEQKFQISNLKRENAIKKRKEKIISVANEVITEYDKNGSNKDKFKQYIKEIQNKRDTFKDEQAYPSKLNLKLNSENYLVINPSSSFSLTLYNSSKKILNNVIETLKNEDVWCRPQKLLPLFAEHNIKCKEVDDYIATYKPIYLKKLQELKSKSEEYKNSSKMDQLDIELEFKTSIINELPERANCKIELLFDISGIDLTIDDKLISKYGFYTIQKYFNLKHYENKIISHMERKEFEDLIKADLVFTSKEIDIEEILKNQTLKTLNKISEKEEGYFKRKNKAIQYLQENKNLLKNVGKYISTRKLFKLKPLPNEFNYIDSNLILDHWSYLEEYIKLIIDTYYNSERNTELREQNNSYIKGFQVTKAEDTNSSFVCQRARLECMTEYSKSNPPKIPFHIGCNCHLRQTI